MTDHDRLNRLADELEIRDLAQRYAVAVTARDLDAVVALFSPYADFGPAGVGRAGADAFYADYFERNGRHAFLQVGTHQVDLIDESTASGVVFTRSWDVGPGPARMDVLVVYFDTYRRCDGRWGFVQRRETLHDAVPAAAADPEAAAPAMTRPWEYWDRWAERKRSGTLFR
jgi:hypothetical protein